MNRNQWDYVRGLVNGELRKKEQGLANFAPKGSQPARVVDESRARLAEKVVFCRETLAAIDEAIRDEFEPTEDRTGGNAPDIPSAAGLSRQGEGARGHVCPSCRGTGADPMSDGGSNWLPCETCQGKGKVSVETAQRINRTRAGVQWGR